MLPETKHLTGIASLLVEKLDIKHVHFCSPLNKLATANTSYGIYGLKKLLNNDNKFIFLDTNNLSVQTTIILCGQQKSYYIQHGYFEITNSRKLRSKTFCWFINHLYYLFIFFCACPKIDIFKKIKIYIVYLLFGVNHGQKVISEYHNFNTMFFIDQKSLKFHSKFYHIKSEKRMLTGYLDEVLSIIYDKSGCAIYISQPLFLTGECDFDSYIKNICQLNKKYDKFVFVIHPKITLDIVISLKNLGINCVQKKDLTMKATRLVLGHFSTLLFAIPPEIPIRILTTIGNYTLYEAENFQINKRGSSDALALIHNEIGS